MRNAIKSTFSSIVVMFILGFCVFIFQFVTTDEDTELHTLNRYKKNANHFFNFKGDVAVTVSAPETTLIVGTVTDNNAYDHRYVNSVLMNVAVNNRLPYPLLMGAARCQLQVYGAIKEFNFPIYDKPDNWNSELFDYWFLPAGTSGYFAGSIALAEQYPNLPEENVKLLGCAVDNIMMDKQLLINETSRKVGVRSEPGYFTLTNQLGSAIKEVTVKCLPVALWEQNGKNSKLMSDYREYQTVQLGSDPLRINETKRYAIPEQRPQVCAMANYKTY